MLIFFWFGSPLLDPLNFELGEATNYERLGMLCEDAAASGSGDWKGKKLNQIQQSRQNDWYGVWVREMARIAKPGAPVIVEQVEIPYCNKRSTWGGVDQDFFRDAVANNTYGWNIQPDSLEFEADTIFHDRYHVFMLKEKI